MQPSTHRTWCPAAQATPDFGIFSAAEHADTDVSPRRVHPQRPQSPKNISAQAARSSFQSKNLGSKLVEKVHASQTFSNRIALSTAVNSGSKLLEDGQLPTYFSAQQYTSLHATAREDLKQQMHAEKKRDPQDELFEEDCKKEKVEEVEGFKLQRQKPAVVVRSGAHLLYHWNAEVAAAPKDEEGNVQVHSKVSNIALCEADFENDELSTILEHPCFDGVQGLHLFHSVKGSNDIPMLIHRLHGNKKKKKTVEEEKENENADEEKEEEDEEAEAKEGEVEKKPDPIIPVSIASLSLVGNPAGFGCALGEEPSASAMEEFARLIGTTTSLKELNLANCSLQPSGMNTLCPALLQNGSIESLDLSANDFAKNDDGAALEALAKLLQESKYLLEVKLDANDFTGSQAKQIFDALAASKTRVVTPEKEPEPEAEEYADELPPEEEKPTVEIGFPKEEKEPEPENEEAGATGEEVEAEKPKEEVKKDPSGEDDDDEDEDEDEKSPAKLEETKAKVQEEIDEDDEEAVRKAEEKAQAEKEAIEAEKQAWDEKQEQFIWGPTRVHFEYNESLERRDILQEHITETTAMKKGEKKAKEEGKQRQLKREKETRERRSGWTHLQKLSMANNPMGSDGAKALASMLRFKIPYSVEEMTQQEEEHTAAEETRKAQLEQEAADRAAAEEERRQREEEEGKERKAREEEEQEAAKKAREEAGEAEPEGETEPSVETAKPKEQEEEVTKEAEPEAPQQLVEEAKPWYAKKDRPGVHTLRYLDLSGCSIGPIGLKSLSATIKDNCPSLQTLLLRKNKFGVRHTEVPDPNVPVPTEDGGEDENTKLLRIDVMDWVSPGMEAFRDCLAINQSLVALDLSYSNLYAVNLNLLSAGLKKNRSLEVLILDGNKFGRNYAERYDMLMALAKAKKVSEEGEEGEGEIPKKGKAAEEGKNKVPTPDAFITLLQSIAHEECILTTLSLANCELTSESLRVDNAEAAKLLRQCNSLTALNLSFNELKNEGVHTLAESLAEGDLFPRLRALSLNQIYATGAEAGEALAHIVKAQTGLKQLEINENQLCNEGFDVLSVAMTNHSALTTFHAHRVGVTNIDKFGAILSSISFLSHLDLGDNEIEPKSFLNFAQGVRVSPSLSFLSIWRREADLEREAVLVMLDALAACPTLLHVDLGNSAKQLVGTSLADLEKFTVQQKEIKEGKKKKRSPEEDDDEEEEEEIVIDEVERIELKCFENRVGVSAGKQK